MHKAPRGKCLEIAQNLNWMVKLVCILDLGCISCNIGGQYFLHLLNVILNLNVTLDLNLVLGTRMLLFNANRENSARQTVCLTMQIQNSNKKLGQRIRKILGQIQKFSDSKNEKLGQQIRKFSDNKNKNSDNKFERSRTIQIKNSDNKFERSRTVQIENSGIMYEKYSNNPYEIWHIIT